MTAPAKKQPTPASSSIPKRAPLMPSGRALYDRPFAVLDKFGWIVSTHETVLLADLETGERNRAGGELAPYKTSQIRKVQ